MLIKHFSSFAQRVPDPMRPGRTAKVGRLRASGSVDPITHPDPSGEGEDIEVWPDENGWYDVPHEVGVQLTRFRDQGSGFYEHGAVADEAALGNIEGPVDAQPEVETPPRKAAAAKKAAPKSSQD